MREVKVFEKALNILHTGSRRITQLLETTEMDIVQTSLDVLEYNRYKLLPHK